MCAAEDVALTWSTVNACDEFNAAVSLELSYVDCQARVVGDEVEEAIADLLPDG